MAIQQKTMEYNHIWYGDKFIYNIIDRPGVAGAVLQTPS